MSEYFFNDNNPWFYAIVLLSIILFFFAPYILVIGFVAYYFIYKPIEPPKSPEQTFYNESIAKYKDTSLADFNFVELLAESRQFMSAEDKSIYLQSPEWFRLRQSVFIRNNSECQSCGSKNNLEVHHITYARLGNENPNDLITLCGGENGCHGKLHKIADTTYNNGYGRENLYPLSLLKNIQSNKE